MGQSWVFMMPGKRAGEKVATWLWWKMRTCWMIYDIYFSSSEWTCHLPRISSVVDSKLCCRQHSVVGLILSSIVLLQEDLQFCFIIFKMTSFIIKRIEPTTHCFRLERDLECWIGFWRYITTGSRSISMLTRREHWVWVDFTPVSFTEPRWQNTEPDSDDRCGVLRGEGDWHGSNCEQLKSFICEKGNCYIINPHKDYKLNKKKVQSARNNKDYGLDSPLSVTPLSRSQVKDHESVWCSLL